MAFVGKNVVLSGGCGGIGSEIAKQLLLQGVNVRISNSNYNLTIVNLDFIFLNDFLECGTL